MDDPQLAPGRSFGGVIAVWVTAAVIGAAIGLFVPPDRRSEWMTLALAACIILAFVLQLARGRAQGFIVRVAAGALGALVVLGVISAGFGLASVIAV